MNRPNIIVLFSDQQRFDTLGCYGQKLPVTPNLDQMAEEGIKFEYAFTPQPVCGPARACIQTGFYPTQTGSYRNDIALNPNVVHLADLFNEAGYETAYVGKWHLASGHANGNIGGDFDGKLNHMTSGVPKYLRGGYKDWWIGADILEFTSHGYGGHMFDQEGTPRTFSHYRSDATTDFAIEYLDQKTSSAPFFMMVSYIEPHHQNDQEAYQGPEGSKEKFADFEVPGDLKGREGDWASQYPDYLGACHSLDQNLGRIRKKLDALGIEEQTVIIYTSDHGSHFKTRNDEYKRSCHDASIRIPMLLHGPGLMGGRSINQLVSLIDLPPTLLDMAGITPPKDWVGRSMLSLIKHEDNPACEAVDWPDHIYVQISESQCGRAIRTKDWKYSVQAPGKEAYKFESSHVYVESFLYDLQKDPFEKHNLIDNPEYDSVKDHLRSLLYKCIHDANEQACQIKTRSEA